MPTTMTGASSPFSVTRTEAGCQNTPSCSASRSCSSGGTVLEVIQGLWLCAGMRVCPLVKSIGSRIQRSVSAPSTESEPRVEATSACSSSRSEASEASKLACTCSAE